MAAALSGRGRWTAVALLILAGALGIRSIHFGNPVIHVDEGFYLLVGDRMWRGALPYVDIWDRKPVGLFLIYAAIRGLGGEGVIQYQLVATLFAAATGFIVARMAARFATIEAATIAGLLSILWLETSGGEGGQAPVFYNLLVAGAALIVMRLWSAPATPARIRRDGLAAMALIGLALQIKYSAVFEGIAFGLMLLWLAWKAEPRSVARTGDAALWIATALLPTALAWGWYAALGHGADFVYANFTSILERAPEGAGVLLKRLGKIVAVLSPLLIAAAVAAKRTARSPVPEAERARRFAWLWCASAWGGFLIFGTYFSHYALPLIPPTALVAAPALSRAAGQRWPAALAAALLLCGVGGSLFSTAKNLARRGDRALVEHVAALIRPRMTNCPYIFDGEAMLYLLTDACLPTRWAFPNHINLTREAPALGMDAAGELRRILAARPSVIVDTAVDKKDLNLAMRAVVRAELRRHYRLVEAVMLPNRKEWRMVYERRAGD